MTIRLKLVLLLVMFGMLSAAMSGWHIYGHLREVKEGAVRDAESSAQAFAVSLVFVDETTGIPPIYKSPSGLRDLIYDRKRLLAAVEDFVVVDVNRRIIGDAVPEEVGKSYDEEHKGSDVELTIKDGVTRTFIEKNAGHPEGIRQLVVPLKTEEGKTVGAVIMEYTAYYNKYIVLIKKEIRIILTFTGLLLFISLGIGYYLAGGIAGNIARLKKATEAMAAGDLEAKAEVGSRDELGDLAAAFNTMAALRKAAEEAVRESGDRFRKLFENSNDAIFIHTVDGRILDANSQAENMMGYPVAVLRTMPVPALHPPEELETSKKAFEETISKGSAKFESRFLHSGGAIIDVEISSRIVDREKGIIQGIVRDITERKRATDALRESEARLALTIASAELATWDWNIKTGHDIFNARWAEMRGYRLEEIEPHVSSWEKGVNPDDLSAMSATLEEHFKGRTPFFQAEYRVRTKSGSFIWILDRGTVLERDADGKPVRMAGIEIDITERKQAEEALKKSEARFRSYIELTGQLAWNADAEGKAVEDIPEWRAFTGQSEAQVKGHGWSEAIHPDDRERVMQIWLEAVGHKGKYEAEIRVRRHDGVYHDFLDRGVPLLDESGQIREWIGTAVDITERKKAEEALRSAHEELLKKSGRLEMFQQVAVNREMRMVEMKEEVNGLLERLGEPRKYLEVDSIKKK